MQLAGLDPRWVDALYERWREDRESLPAEWRAFFTGFELGYPAGEAPDLSSTRCRDCIGTEWKVKSMIDAWRRNGHLHACSDPLSPCTLEHPELEPAWFGIMPTDMDQPLLVPDFVPSSGTPREILQRLRTIYGRSIGFEFMHISDTERRRFLLERIETPSPPLAPDERLSIARSLMKGTLLEQHLHRRYVGQKRFSLEGGESLLPLLERLIDRFAHAGGREVVIGMAHRGRLNVLANILGKPLPNIFAEFEDNLPAGVVGEGDVKYHKGFSADRPTPHGTVHLTLAFNPSHLELVTPVVLGKCRALQDLRIDTPPSSVVPVIIHGDAAFAGQGVVTESLNLSRLEGYETGGAIHLVLNNQIGFTTSPRDARSFHYPTDPAKTVEAPVFHVSGDDPESVWRVATLAMEYRQRFGGDVVIDLVCYRRHGHNEGDEPFFTQPLLYERIRERPTSWDIYRRSLQEDGFPLEELSREEEEYRRVLEESHALPPDPDADRGYASRWHGISRLYDDTPVDTTLSAETLRRLIETITTIPDGFTPHPKIARLLAQRRETVEQGEGIDWGCAELLALASLREGGVPVRLSGQDSRRGTFNHRHAVIYDQKTGEPYSLLTPFTSYPTRGPVYDSPLSELSVLGFEYGYSLPSPAPLVIWEAQFGDFANGAQPVIDQFIASGESKWDRSSGIVLFLPHGYEGQGAEHSSGRIERFLQLCAGENMIIATPTTPAQIFHLLRRQVKRTFRKPLILFTPKTLLRSPDAVSPLSDLTTRGFSPVLGDDTVDPRRVSTAVISSGKLHYDLLHRRREKNRLDTALLRLEEIYPFPATPLRMALSRYPALRRLILVQEEPENMGWIFFLTPRIRSLVDLPLEVVSRPPSAAVATGSHRQHGIEQEELLQRLFP
ncbi:MAG: 2-oxoglutarate dehydrogenase E1 component [Desulfuromonadia bacterium]